MAIAEDASTPAIKTGTGTAPLQSDAFSPPAGSLLVVLVAGGFSSGSSSSTVSITDSVSGTYSTVNANACFAVKGVAQVAYRYLSTAPGSMTVTATYANLSGGRYLAVKVLTGAASSQTGATASADIGDATATTAFTASITTTTANSLVYGVINDGQNNDALSAAANTTLISNYLDPTPDFVSLASFKATSVTGTPGATTLGCTAAAAGGGNLAMLEVLPNANTTITGTDTGSGSDAGHAAPNGTDTGSVVDALSIVAGVQLYGTESGAGAASATVVAAVPASDSGSAADTATVVATVPAADTGQVDPVGSHGEFAQAAVTVPVSNDPGSGADSATVSVVTFISASDTGLGVDSSGTGPVVTIAETGSSAEAALISAATIVAADVAVGTDVGGHIIAIDPKGERTVIVNKESRVQHVPEDK